MIGGWEVIFWDVGQGDATTVKLPDGSYILIDAGPATQKGNPLPGWFRRMGGPPIRLAVVTHSHIDHFGGLISLCNEDGQRIDSIAVLKDAGLERQSQLLMALQTRKSTGTVLRLIDKVQTLYEDAVLRLRIVHPKDITEKSKLPTDVNKTSMIILLERVDNPSGEPLIVFGGDAPLPAIRAACCGLAPCVLTGPHHGHPQGTKKWERKIIGDSFVTICDRQISLFQLDGTISTSYRISIISRARPQRVRAFAVRNWQHLATQIVRQTSSKVAHLVGLTSLLIRFSVVVRCGFMRQGLALRLTRIKRSSSRRLPLLSLWQNAAPSPH